MSNPYWEEVQNFPRETSIWGGDEWEVSWRDCHYDDLYCLSPEQYKNVRYRGDLCVQYSWSIPDPLSLAFVSEHLGGTAIEIGSGCGYWAYCLAQMGTHVICYDIAPPHLTPTNAYHSPRTGRYDGLSGQLRQVWKEVYYGNHNKAALYTYPLFLCWPPMTAMATKALKCYQGDKVVYIGEGECGCNADEAFFDLLDKEWEKIASHKPIQWSGIHDWIEVFSRK